MLIAKCRRKKNLDIIHNDTLCIQQKPELRFIHPLEGLLKVLPFPVLRCRQYHQHRICTLETHIQHSLDMYTITLEPLTRELRPDVLCQLVESREKDRHILWSIECRTRFL